LLEEMVKEQSLLQKDEVNVSSWLQEGEVKDE
jgi:hypothetical protein